jgi:hypothetical protein
LRANTPLPTVPVNDFSSLTERVSRRSETVSATSTCEFHPFGWYLYQVKALGREGI